MCWSLKALPQHFNPDILGGKKYKRSSCIKRRNRSKLFTRYKI